MKTIQNRSLYWAGSPGAVYSAINRLRKKKLLVEVKLESEKTKVFRITPQGLRTFYDFLKVPVPASKLILDPTVLRIKLRALVYVDKKDRVNFYQAQTGELKKAQEIVLAKRSGIFGEKVSEQLADLAVAQLQLELDLIEQLLARDLHQG